MPAVYTFADLQQQVLATLDEAGDTSTTLTLVKDYLNQAQQARLASANWPFLRWEEGETLTIVPQERFYTLHAEFWRPIYFFNTGTQEFCRLIPERMTSQTTNRWLTNQGRARDFRWAGYSPVAVQPDPTLPMVLTSSNAADSGAAKVVSFTGVYNGLVRTGSITPNGTSGVGSVTGFSKLLRVTVHAPWVGVLTLTNGSTTLLELAPGELGRMHPRIELNLLPTTADVIEYKFYRQPLKMYYDNDVPDIPPPHSQILVWDTLMLFGGYNTDIRPQNIAIWKEMRDRMDLAMREDFLEGNEVDAMPRLIRNMEDDFLAGFPRVNT